MNSYFTFFSQSLKHVYSSDVNVFPFLSSAIKYVAPFAHCLEKIHPREGEELEAGIAHPSLNYEKGKKKTIRANLQMERKIYAQNNSTQLLVQLIL